MINQQIPEPIHPLLENYVLLTSKELPNLISGFHIVGSIALGEFNELFSDIDFVAVLNREISQVDIERLITIHKRIEKDFPNWKLSGCYLQIYDLGRFENDIKPHPYYHDGKFHTEGYFEINSITWWTLKHHGIAIIGKEAADLPFTVDWNLLIAKMKQNLNSYWVSWTNRMDRFLVMFSDWGIQWTVLGVLRQYYTLRENSIPTKRRAAEYALASLPIRWHSLIQEAIDIREGKTKLHYRSKIVRMIDAVRFLKYVIQKSNVEFH
jgi:Aminoglycoside adenylyltransferase, C-terminal domain/Nucleotidyltransferase domain